MLDTQRIVSELRAEVNRLERAIRSVGRNEYNPSHSGYEGDWNAVTQETPPSDCGRTQAIVYVDEKEMGGAAHAAQAFETESINRIAVSSTGLYRWNRSIDCPQETYFASDVMAVETILPAPSPDHAET